MQVTYFHHSGFAVETETKVLVFDYYSQGGKFDYFDPEKYRGKDLIFFVSHGHDDHFDKKILTWADRGAYVIFGGIKLPTGFGGEVFQVEAHGKYEFHGMSIETLLSNDEGVAFLVEVDGKKIYHAGDLNWWHWNGEGESFNDAIAASYKAEIALLEGAEVDVAFIPADLRLEDKYFWAVDYFMKEVGAKAAFPMHFWGRFDVCRMLQKKPYGERMMNITEGNETFSL